MYLCGASTSQGAGRVLDRRANVRRAGRDAKVSAWSRAPGKELRFLGGACAPTPAQASRVRSLAPRTSQVWGLLDVRKALACRVKMAFRGGCPFGE